MVLLQVLAKHKVVDNNHPIPPGLIFYPRYLQAAGYDTAFIGKWHMGDEGDGPQPGFDHWVSFKGQGTYLPSADGLNVDGRKVPQKGYITDELTDYTMDWLEKGHSLNEQLNGRLQPVPNMKNSCQGDWINQGNVRTVSVAQGGERTRLACSFPRPRGEHLQRMELTGK